MGKKPADQTSNQPSGSGDSVDLETELDGDDATDTDSDADEDDDADSSDSSTDGGTDIQSRIDAAVDRALERATRAFEAETDRRVNQALAKQAGKGPAKTGTKDDDSGNGGGQVTATADVRGARIAFREYLPDTIKLLGTEERQIATEIGQSLIRSRAFDGFEDEDAVGREVATQTAEILKKARTFYSGRTKRVLEKQGALIPQSGGQSSGGGGQKDTPENAYEAALRKDKELHPERYANQQ